MKINILSPYRKGGPYRWSEDLARELKKNNIQARHVHGLFELLGSPFFQNCDLVHTTVPIPFSLWKKPMVLTIHGDYRKERNIWSGFYPLAIKKADRVTVPSEFLKKELGIEKAFVIPNGIEPGPFAEGRPFDKNHLKFVTVTNFNFADKAKGIEILIGILEKFRQRNSIHYSFEIVGGGKFLKKIKEKHAHKSYLIFTGFSQNVEKILSKNDLFLYYSFHDNFPIVILEAMAHGLPILTNIVGAIPEIITSDTEGYLSENENDFIKNLEKVLERPDELLRIRESAYQKVKRMFAWERIIHLYSNSYEELLKK